MPSRDYQVQEVVGGGGTHHKTHIRYEFETPKFTMILVYVIYWFIRNPVYQNYKINSILFLLHIHNIILGQKTNILLEIFLALFLVLNLCTHLNLCKS